MMTGGTSSAPKTVHIGRAAARNPRRSGGAATRRVVMSAEKKQEFCALIADVKGSRSYEPARREELQLTIGDSLALLNGMFSTNMVKPMMFSAGDEVQGLFDGPAAAFLAYRLLAMLLRPCELKGGMGIGDWSVRMTSPESTMQDGSAYHDARDAVEFAKKSRLYDAAFWGSRCCDPRRTVLADHPLGIQAMRTAAQADAALAIELARPITGSKKAWSDDEYCEAVTHVLSHREPLRDRAATLVDRILQRNGKWKCPVQPVSYGDGIGTVDEASAALTVGLAPDLRGMPYELAELSGMSRQGIARLVSQARVEQERNAASVFCELAERGW